jgi:hypothetical protein
MGDPNATDIPAAAAADRTSRFRAVQIRHGSQDVTHKTTDLRCHLYYRTVS